MRSPSRGSEGSLSAVPAAADQSLAASGFETHLIAEGHHLGGDGREMGRASSELMRLVSSLSPPDESARSIHSGPIPLRVGPSARPAACGARQPGREESPKSTEVAAVPVGLLRDLEYHARLIRRPSEHDHPRALVPLGQPVLVGGVGPAAATSRRPAAWRAGSPRRAGVHPDGRHVAGPDVARTPSMSVCTVLPRAATAACRAGARSCSRAAPATRRRAPPQYGPLR
jgi:hypothetical protein